jgi:hypothetical protein
MSGLLSLKWMVRLVACLALLTPVLAACTAVPRDPDPVIPSQLKKFAACDAEMRAFVTIAKLVRQQGDNWTIYEPALQAMREQILDCVEDSYTGSHPI